MPPESSGLRRDCIEDYPPKICEVKLCLLLVRGKWLFCWLLFCFRNRIPQVAKSLGKGITEFKKGVNSGEEEDDDDEELPPKKSKKKIRQRVDEDEDEE